MKKIYNIILIVMMIVCLAGCGKKETEKEEIKRPSFKQEFKLICDEENEYHDDSTNSKTYTKETITFNKDGYVTSIKRYAMLESFDDETFEIAKETIKEWEVEKPTYKTSVDEKNKIVTYEYENKYNPQKFNKEQLENGYITEFLKSREKGNNTCSFEGITREEIEKAA